MPPEEIRARPFASAVKELLLSEPFLRTVEATIWIAGIVRLLYARTAAFAILYDEICELAAAYNLVHGAGLNYVLPLTRDIAATTTSPLSHWPPGPSLLFAAGLAVLKKPVYAALAADLLGILVLLTGVWRLAAWVLEPLPRWSRPCVAAYLIFVAPPMRPTFYFSNAAAAGCFLWGLYFLSGALDNGSIGRSTAGAFLFAVSAALRFQYWPIAWVPLAVAIVLVRFDNDFGWKPVVAHALSLAIFFSPLIAWARAVQGQGYAPLGPVANAPPGLHFENLKPFHPFASDALFGNILDVLLPQQAAWLKWIVFVPVVLVAAAGAAEFAVRSRPASSPSRRAFVWIGAASILAMVGELAVLSVKNEKQDLFGGWTYVQEPRYYMLALPLILIWLFAFAGFSKRFKAIRVAVVGTFLVAAALRCRVAVMPKPAENWPGRLVTGLSAVQAEQKWFVKRLEQLHDPARINVYIEIGEPDNASHLRMSMANLLDYRARIERRLPFDFMASEETHVVLGSQDPDVIQEFRQRTGATMVRRWSKFPLAEVIIKPNIRRPS